MRSVRGQRFETTSEVSKLNHFLKPSVTEKTNRIQADTLPLRKCKSLGNTTLTEVHTFTE